MIILTLLNSFKRHIPANREEYSDEEAWASLRAAMSEVNHGAGVVPLMDKPTISEFKRVLAVGEHADLRRSLIELRRKFNTLKSRTFDDSLDALRNQRDHEFVPRNPYWDTTLDISAWWVWIGELAEEAEFKARENEVDAALPPPAPAAPSTRGRF